MKIPNERIELAVDTWEGSRVKDVYFDAEKCRLVATDGHQIAIIPADPGAGDVGGLIPTRAFALARAAAKRIPRHLKKMAIGFRLIKKAVTIWGHDNEVAVVRRFSDSLFPKYESVIPKISGKPDVVFDVGLLLKLVNSLSSKNVKPGSAAVALWIDKSDRPSKGAILVAPIKSSGLGVLMPMREEELDAKKVLARIEPKAEAAN